MLILLALLLLAPPAAAERWRWPVRGEVLTPFHVGANPFAGGQHRGIDIAAAAGARVRSTCPGRVRFAGSVPGRGRAVSVLCGPFVATYLELGKTAVARGARVVAGQPIGTVAASHLQLGARRAGDRNGYVDPLTLLTTDRLPPVGVAPRGVAPRGVVPRGAAPRGAAARPRPAPTAGEVGRVPPAAWLGLALFAAGTPLGALWHRRRRTIGARRLEPRPEGRGGDR